MQNTGNTSLYGVVAGASLPPHASYVSGSTVLAADLDDAGKQLPDGIAGRRYDVPNSPPATRGGVNVGTLTPGQETVVRFAMQLDAEAGADMRAVGFVSATGHNEYYNTLVIYTEPEA